MIISKNITVTTTTKLANKLSDYAKKVMDQRADKAIAAGVKAGQNVIEETLRENRVVKSLLGEFADYPAGYDLQAEFGLTKNKAREAVDEMLKILRSTVKPHFAKTPEGSRLILTGHMTALDSADYESSLKNGSKFRYQSVNRLQRKQAKRSKKKAASTEIRWMEVLLEAKNPSAINIIPGISGYGIKYDLTARSAIQSRSGRALMKQISLRRNRSLKPYKMPKLAIPQIGSSKNFIEDIEKDRRWVAHWGKQIHKAMYKVMLPDKPLPGYLRD
jgi:hypothetical protein